jgi:hypothetical protein
MTRLASACALAVLLSACSAASPQTACDLLPVDEIASVLKVAGVRPADGSGFNKATSVDTCRWTAEGGSRLELRLYRANPAAESAFAMVFESSKAHATLPGADGRVRARSLSGVGDEAMFLPGVGSAPASVAFRVGRSGAVIAGTASEAALVDLAKRAAGRL